jgi:hypothetical protein
MATLPPGAPSASESRRGGRRPGATPRSLQLGLPPLVTDLAGNDRGIVVDRGTLPRLAVPELPNDRLVLAPIVRRNRPTLPRGRLRRRTEGSD